MTLVIAVGILIGLVILTVGTALIDKTKTRRRVRRFHRETAEIMAAQGIDESKVTFKMAATGDFRGARRGGK